MWWVFIVAGLGWLFDVMDQRIFVLSRNSALDELLSTRVEEGDFHRMLEGKMLAAEAERLAGAAAGIAPEAPVRVELPTAQGGRPALVLPPVKAEGKPRKVPFVRPKDSAGAARFLPEPDRVDLIGRIATAIFLVGWATGGLLFGILGDRWGRARTMVLTILVYSLFTGLSALSVSWVDYSIYRFLTGMGVGGEFAAGAALVAEVMTPRARPYALGLLQALSALGNILGSLIGKLLLSPAHPEAEWEGWRGLYLVGVLPALLFVVVGRRLKEPERWQAMKASAGNIVGKQLGAFGDLFHSRWRRSTQFGLLFAVSGVIGLWGIAFWTPELIKSILPDPNVRSYAMALQDVGAFLGIAAIALVTQGAPRTRGRAYIAGLLASIGAAVVFLRLGGGKAEAPLVTALLGVSLSFVLYFACALVGAFSGGLGRRASFAFSFAAALVATILVFRYMTEVGEIYWMIPVLGFCTLLCFGMYAIYFPELYPTRLRTTGTGFCYNVARYVAAGGLFLLGYIGSLGIDFRTSTQVFALIYLVGLGAAAFAPETRGRPLVEE